MLAYEDLPFELPLEYRPRACRKDEYLELRRRGATQLMCEEFHLEFSDEEGIYAWADSDLFDEFADPNVMQEGDFWKIHLGRRIVLEGGDLDGSKFIEGILEDALLFPLFGPCAKGDSGKWETVEEEPGIWVTRLKTGQKALDHDAASILSDDEAAPEEIPSQPADPANPIEEAPMPQRMLLINEYDVSYDEPEDEDEAEHAENVYEDSDIESEHPCECPRENMCLVCTTEPDASWSDIFDDDQENVDELQEDLGDGTSEISAESETSDRSTEF